MLEFAIAQNAAISDAKFKGQGYIPLSIEMPSGWDAATISFQGGESATGTFFPLYKDDGNLYSVTVTTSRLYALNPDIVRALSKYSFIKILASANQTTAARTVKVTLGCGP